MEGAGRSPRNKETNRWLYELGHVRGDLFQELAHVLMETKNCYDLLSERWRSRKAGGVIQSSLKARKLGGRWYKSWSDSESPRTRRLHVRG